MDSARHERPPEAPAGGTRARCGVLSLRTPAGARETLRAVGGPPFAPRLRSFACWILLVVLVIASAGGCCTTVDRIGVKALDPSRHAEVTKRAARDRALVVLADGRRIEARDLKLSGDVASWRDAGSGEPGGAETRLIREVRFGSRGRGARNGAIYGGLAGVGLGVALGLLHKDGEPHKDGEMYHDGDSLRTEETVAAGVLFGLAGVVLGVPIGAMTGGEDVYQAPLPALPGLPGPAAAPAAP